MFFYNRYLKLFDVPDVEVQSVATTLDSSIEDIFAIPQATKNQEKSKAITSHRLLTSEYVVEVKKKKKKEGEKEQNQKWNKNYY